MTRNMAAPARRRNIRWILGTIVGGLFLAAVVVVALPLLQSFASDL